MEKKISKWKIILISVAIVLAIASFSVCIFGLIEKHRDKKSSNNVKAWGSDDGIRLRSISQTINGVTYGVDYTSSSITFRYNGRSCLVGEVGGSTFSYTADNDDKNGAYTGTYIKKDEFKIKMFTVYNDNGYKLYSYLRSNGLYIQYYHLDYDSIGKDDISSKDFTYSCSAIQHSLVGSVYITVDGAQYQKSYHWMNGLTYKKYSESNNFLTCDPGGQVSIYSAEALKLFAYELKDESCVHNSIFQTAQVTVYEDLDMSEVSNMIPIGTSSVPFGGIFEGNKLKISKLTVKLFDYVENAKIRNILLDEMNTTHCAPFAYSVKHSEIDNIFVKGFEFQYKVKSVDSYVGGLIGVISDGTTITNCRVDVGGEAKQETVTIPNSLTGTDIYCNTVMYCGGIVGIAKGDNNKIDNCFVNWTCGAKAGYDMYFGGACGYSEKNININNTLIYFKSGYASNGYYIKDSGNSGKVQGKTAFAGSTNLYSVSANSSLSNTYVFYGDIEFKKLSCRNGNRGASNNNQPLVNYYTVSTDTNSLNRQGFEYNDSLG